MMNSRQIKIALVHDYLIQMGGAERVVAALHELFPEAPIFTSVSREKLLSAEFADAEIRTSFLQRWPLMEKNFRIYFLLYPLAFASLDLSEYDVIISSSSAYAKGIKKRKGQVHVCYCHTPMRFAWRFDDYISRQGLNPLLARLISGFVPFLKKWDRETAKNVDYFISNSSFIADRIRSIYDRDSVIINPPVDTGRFRPLPAAGNYFLVASRLAAYKRIDLAVKVFSGLGLPLKITGEGPAENSLKKIAGPTVEFLGKVPDEELAKLYAGCRALVFPGEEDFGITPLEAAASGRPTVAFGRGGARETVIDGRTGVLFEEQTEASLARALKRFDSIGFDRELLGAHAKKFGKEIFKEKIKGFLNENKIF